MTIQIKKSDIYDTFNVSVEGDTMTMHIQAHTCWDYGHLCDLLKEEIKKGVRHILVDKRNHITRSEGVNKECSIQNMGAYFMKKKVRFAAVLNEKDHLEKIACYTLSRPGGQVLSTYCINEAMLWLGGEVR